MEILHTAVYWLGWVFVLLIQFIVLFTLYYKHYPDFPWWLKAFAVIFWIEDVLLNITVFSVFYLEVPKEWTITERMSRYKKQFSHESNWLAWWRHRSAVNLCRILNLFDPDHC